MLLSSGLLAYADRICVQLDVHTLSQNLSLKLIHVCLELQTEAHLLSSILSVCIQTNYVNTPKHKHLGRNACAQTRCIKAKQGESLWIFCSLRLFFSPLLPGQQKTAFCLDQDGWEATASCRNYPIINHPIRITVFWQQTHPQTSCSAYVTVSHSPPLLANRRTVFQWLSIICT